MCLIIQNEFHLAFLIKTTHVWESQLSLQLGTAVNFVDVNSFGSGKVGIVTAAIHLAVPGYVLFPPKILSGWKKDDFWPFVPAPQTSGSLVGASSSYWTGTIERWERSDHWISFLFSSLFYKTSVSVFSTFWEFCIQKFDPTKL